MNFRFRVRCAATKSRRFQAFCPVKPEPPPFTSLREGIERFPSGSISFSAVHGKENGETGGCLLVAGGTLQSYHLFDKGVWLYLMEIVCPSMYWKAEWKKGTLYDCCRN